MKLKWPQKIHKNRKRILGVGFFWLVRIYTPDYTGGDVAPASYQYSVIELKNATNEDMTVL